MRYDYIVLYSSETGNTKKLATEIFAMLPGMYKDLIDINEYDNHPEADTYFVGFWTSMENCDASVLEFLPSLHGKKIALFGTCGMGDDTEYKKSILGRVISLIPNDNQFLGGYLCQGKMPISIRKKLEAMYETSPNKDRIASLLHNFDRALLHPNQNDYDQAKLFVNAVVEQLGVKKELGCVNGDIVR